MPRSPAPSLPMTLGNMRAQGMRSLAVPCWLCHRGAVLSTAGHTPPLAALISSAAFFSCSAIRFGTPSHIRSRARNVAMRALSSSRRRSTAVALLVRFLAGGLVDDGARRAQAEPGELVDASHWVNSDRVTVARLRHSSYPCE